MFKKIITIFTIFALVLTLWSVPTGMPVRASQLSNVSDTMSRLKTGIGANHTIQFTTPSGVTPGQTIVLTFPVVFNMGTVDHTDIDLEDDGANVNLAASPSGSTWGASPSGQVITFTNGNTTVAADSIIKIEIGTNTDWQTVGDAQITNPSSAGTRTINFAGTFGDSATIGVVILDNDQVVVTAEVGPVLSFSIEGLPTSTALGGTNSALTDSIKVATASTLPFGDQIINLGAVLGQKITVTTNGGNGYQVTLGQNHDLTSAANDIDDFPGTNAVPQKWEDSTNPFGIGSNIDSGWFGYTTNDETLSGASVGRFGVGADAAGYLAGFTQSNTSYEIAYNSAPAVNGESTKIGFKLEVNAFQPSGNYSNTLTYVCTAVY